MLNINFKVTESSVEIMEKSEILPSGNLKKIKCIFDLDTAYDDLIVRAVFNGRFVTVENGECFAPLLNSGMCVVGVYGYAVNNNGEFETILSPKPTSTYISLGSYNENDAQSDNPTPTELEEHYNRVKELVDSGKLKGDPGEKGDKGDKGDTGATGATGPQGPPGKDAVTDTEMSTESNNAIANSTVSKILAYGNLVGFERIDSLDDLAEFNNKYPSGISEDAFIVLYMTSELSYSDPDGSFDYQSGLYILTSNDTFRLCPDAESIDLHFKTIDDEIDSWLSLINLKANRIELEKVKTELSDVSNVADEALTVARGRNRALCFSTKQELDSWLNGEFQREDGKTKADLQVGDNLYIVEVGVPDYWWDGEQIRPLETQKVDLSEYAEKEYVNEKVEQEVSVPNSDIANYLEVADAIGLWKTVTANITNFDNMFQGRTDITKIPELDMSSATSAKNLCNGCSNLKSFVNRTTSNVTTFYSAFKDCTVAETIDIDTSKNTQFNGMFWNCSSLKELNIDMSRAAGMDYMCRSCTSLESIKTVDFTGASPAASGKNYSNMFTYCPNLIHIEIVPESIKGNLSFVNSAKLDSESVANIFNGLADMSDYDTHTLTLHADVQITQAQADAAVAKNWNIVGGTVNG